MEFHKTNTYTTKIFWGVYSMVAKLNRLLVFFYQVYMKHVRSQKKLSVLFWS